MSDVLPGRGLVIMHRGSARNPVVFAMSPSYTIIVLVLLLASGILVVRVLTRKRGLARRAVWDGGVRRLTPAMTYTATGFSNPVRVVFNSVLRPVTIQDSKETIAQHFLDAIKKDRRDVHVVDRLLIGPVLLYGRGLALWLARMHSGRVNAYAAYILIPY